MSTNNRNVPIRRILGQALDGAMQWRLWLLWIGASLGCALIAALPAWNWLAASLNNSVHAPAIASGKAPALLIDMLLSRNAPKRTARSKPSPTRSTTRSLRYSSSETSG